MGTDARIEAFKQRWLASSGAERANSQPFLLDLCELMGVPKPDVAKNDPAHDSYVFEKHVRFAHPGGDRAGFIDLYKRGCFVLESKQGANEHKKGGFAKRDTPTWENEMEKARGQAKGYAQTLDEVPPFLVVCDVGHVFEIHASFDGAERSPIALFRDANRALDAARQLAVAANEKQLGPGALHLVCTDHRELHELARPSVG